MGDVGIGRMYFAFVKKFRELYLIRIFSRVRRKLRIGRLQSESDQHFRSVSSQNGLSSENEEAVELLQ